MDTHVNTELLKVFRDVFEDDFLLITRETTAANVPGWDSLQHVTLILAIEARFRIRLSSAEVADVQTVGDLIDIVELRCQGIK